MSEHNLFVSSHQDDSDITIIHPSIMHEDHTDYVNNTYVPIIARLRQANNSSENRQTTNSQSMITQARNNNANDFIFVDHNPQENAKQIEQVLTYYIRDLKQENKSQLECVQQLITRLMDLIRPGYPNDQKKMIELDQIMREIGSLHDDRHVKSEEKIQQLRTEICQLNKMLCSTRDELSNCSDSPQNFSAATSIQPVQRQSMHDYEQWTEIEDDAKKLQQIVQTQKNQINEIVNLISQSATASNSLNLPDVPENNSHASTADNPTSPAHDKSFISNLLQKIHNITSQQTPQPSIPTTTSSSQETILENHSPGSSPTQSLATLTLTSLKPIEEPGLPKVHIEEPIQEQPPQSIDEKEPRKCPICNVIFEPTINDVEMYDHIDRCLFPSPPAVEPKNYECPQCSRKWPADEEATYHQHLSDCFNRDF